MNINMTSALSQTLERFMRLRGIRTKSEAVRIALQEGLERSLATASKTTDFSLWIGAAKKADENPQPRFKSHSDLW